MAYRPPELLDDLADLFADLRTWAGVIEKRPGVFYAHKQPFLHFHLLAGRRRRADIKGHCCLVLKPHVIELYELSDEDSAAFMRDVKVASLALKKVTGAVKINYEIHGNTIPHMHMHLYPRQIGDRFENGPIDWRGKTPKTYEDGEFEAFIERMKTAIKDVEQGAAADADTRRR